jgi:hypothetical protein
MAGRTVAVAPVQLPRDWRDFHNLRRTLYKHDRAAVMPLVREERLLLDVSRHPFWQHAEREVFLARRGDRVVGRIAAIIDRQHQDHHSDRTGFFGFFECGNEPDVATALLRAAADWLFERNCESIRGPVSPSMKGEFGVVVEGNDAPPSVMMPHTPAWYDALLCGCGLAPAHNFVGFTLTRDEVLARGDHWQRLSETCKRILSRHPELEIRTGTGTDVAETLREVNRLANRIRASVYGFVPITDAETEFLIVRLRRVMLPELVVTVRRAGEIVGYTISIPDVNWALARTFGRSDLVRLAQMPFLLRRIPRLRLLAQGTVPKFRSTGILSLLFFKTIEIALPRYRQFEFSWISEANLASIKVLKHILPMEPSRRFRLYQAPLPLR